MTRFSLVSKSLMLLFVLLAWHAAAQKITPYVQTTSVVLELPSKVLNETRTIFIHHPKADSTNSNKMYPVLYVMDGESHFDMFSQYTDYLSRWDVNVIPQMIIVGIVNTKRTRDLTPTESIINYFGQPDTSRVSWMKPSGGNDRFLQFIREELKPYVERHYKTQPYSILAGHSFGGLASVYCLLTHPDMFQAYISVSPSFWWDQEYVLKLADQKLKKDAALNKTLFLSDASEGMSDSSTFHTNLLKFDAILKAKTMTALRYQYNYYPKETHMTEPMPAYYDALRFIYKDWKKL
jgi:predicted alpha/beta superfamily hydrolase